MAGGTIPVAGREVRAERSIVRARRGRGRRADVPQPAQEAAMAADDGAMPTPDSAANQAGNQAANKELVRRYFEQVFNQLQVDACDALVADRYLEHALAPFGQTEPGPVAGPQHLRDTVG